MGSCHVSLFYVILKKNSAFIYANMQNEAPELKKTRYIYIYIYILSMIDGRCIKSIIVWRLNKINFFLNL
jgi:hypothetical protein